MRESIYIRVGKRIQELAKERQLSLNALADSAEMDRGHLSRIVRGRIQCRLRTIERIADALDVPWVELFK